jgi:hypothetical protein
MKTLPAIALIALLSAVGQAQSRTMADATHAIKGPVKTFRTEIATFVVKDGQSVEGPRQVREEAWFNRDGYRTDYHIYANGELARRIVMKYEGRKMLECINYNGRGEAYLRIVNTYDEAGKVKEVNTYHGDGSLRSTTIIKRNTRGQLLESVERSAQGVLMEQMNYQYEGKDVYSWVRKIYDGSGTLVQDEIYVAPDKKTFIRYNRDGSVVSRIVRIGQEMAQYGPDGSLQKATVIAPEDRLLDEMTLKKNGSATRETQLPDEIDQHGNWTKQTKWYADPKGTRPLMVTYRALTYYEN